MLNCESRGTCSVGDPWKPTWGDGGKFLLHLVDQILDSLRRASPKDQAVPRIDVSRLNSMVV